MKSKMKVIDFHTHLLAGIDDGSRSREMTAQMLDAAKAQGVEVLVATPHFYADRMSLRRFAENRRRALEEACPLAEERGIRLIRGAEVAFFSGISHANDLEELCLEGTDLLLLEMPFRPWTDGDLQEVDSLLRRGYSVILAHPERFLPAERKAMSALLDLPVLVQINGGSLLNRRTRRKAVKLLGRGDALLGSDCHNLTDRPVNLQAGRNAAAELLGADFLARLDQLGDQLLFS